MYPIPNLDNSRTFFLSHATQSIDFRKEQLNKLKRAIHQYIEVINEALYSDLKKSKEEVWVTEVGIVLSEIDYFLKHIEGLATPQKVSTNFINQPGKSYIVNEPLGIVLIIAPWNYPFQLAFLPLVGAIAAGNGVVIKPSELAIATQTVIQKIIAETFEPQYISCAIGSGEEVVPVILNRFRVDHIFYTGSPAVGKIIYRQAAEQLTPVTLELGGKNPCLVTAGANLKLTARRIALGKFLNAGQTCIAPDFILIHESVKSTFLDLLKQTIIDFYGEHPVESYDYGRIINKKHFARLMEYIRNNNVIFGGTHNEEILYISPTIIDTPDRNAPIMKDEIFGPLLPIITYSSEDEAIGIIRQHENPLAFYIFTNDTTEADRWLKKVPSGGACVNAVAMHYINKNLPFGGRGNSGIGRYHGKFSMETFSHQKGILKAASWPDLRIAYPSFKGKLSLLKKIFN